MAIAPPRLALSRFVPFLLSLAVTTFSSFAQADGAPAAPTDAARAEAAQRYNRGRELYAEENFGAALVEFRKSYELTGEYRVLYNIGQVCFQMQDYVCALDAFDRYLTQGGTGVPASRQQEVKTDLEKLKARVGQLRIVTNVPGAAISVDDVPRGTTPIEPITVNAGRHRVTATKTGKVAATAIVDLAGSETRDVSLELADQVATPVIVRETAAPTAPPSRWTTLSYVGLGASAAMAAGAVVTGVLALDASNKVAASNYYLEPSAEDKSQQSKAQALAITTDVLIAASAVTLGTTLVLTLTRKVPSEGAATATLSAGFGSVSMRGTF